MCIKNQLKCLGDDSRLRILALLQRGMLNVQELTAVLHLSQPTVSHHLKTLSSNNFVESTRDGNRIYYRLSDSTEETSERVIREAALKAITLREGMLRSAMLEDQHKVNKLVAGRTEKSKDYFNAVASEWSTIREHALGQENFLNAVAKMIPDEVTFLEIGCGAGALLDIILPRSGETIGVDYSEAMLTESRKNLGERISGVDLRLGYIEHLPIANDSVDVVVGYMVLHHTANPIDALADIHRVLRKGGRCIIVDLLAHDKEYMRKDFADVWLGFSSTQMQEWMEGLGFTSVSCSALGDKAEVFMTNCKK